MPHLHFIRLYIDDIILLEVVNRRVESGFRTRKVHYISFLDVTLRTDNPYVLTVAVDSKVSSHGKRIQYVQVVLVERKVSRTSHLSHDGDAKVHELNSNHRVEPQVHEALFHENTLYTFRSLAPCKTGQIDLAHHREVNLALRVKGVTAHLRIVVRTFPGCSSQSLSNIRKIQNCSGLRILGVDHDGNHVSWLKTDGCLRQIDSFFLVCSILEISNLGRG